MLVQLCVILRMVINEGNQLSLDKYEIVPCAASRESMRDNTLKEFSDKPHKNYLWTHNPMTQMMLPRPDNLMFLTRPALFRKASLSLTKLSKTLQNDFSPSFRKSDFQFERRNKPITLLAFRNPKNDQAQQQKALYKTVNASNNKSGELKSGEVAVMQSPYNDVSAFWQDIKDA